MSRKFSLNSEEKKAIAERMNFICKERDYADLKEFTTEKIPKWDSTKVISDWNLGKSINFSFIIFLCNELEASLDFVLSGKEPPFRKPPKK